MSDTDYNAPVNAMAFYDLSKVVLQSSPPLKGRLKVERIGNETRAYFYQNEMWQLAGSRQGAHNSSPISLGLWTNKSPVRDVEVEFSDFELETTSGLMCGNYEVLTCSSEGAFNISTMKCPECPQGCLKCQDSSSCNDCAGGLHWNPYAAKCEAGAKGSFWVAPLLIWLSIVLALGWL
jgi:hypothetical protein